MAPLTWRRNVHTGLQAQRAGPGLDARTRVNWTECPLPRSSQCKPGLAYFSEPLLTATGVCPFQAQTVGLLGNARSVLFHTLCYPAAS